MMKIVINGYGTPQNILTDNNYHAYLTQVFNILWVNFRDKNLMIIPVGGNSDLVKPYRKTEAGEMAKWLKIKINSLALAKKWKIKICATKLSALENMLAVKKMTRTDKLWYFCEQTRKAKMQVLAKKIFGARARVIPIEFDSSPARYNTAVRKSLEQEDLQYSLLALRDAKWRQILRKYSREKIKILRSLNPDQRRIMTDIVARDLKRKYYQNYR